jgi:hypothetical protein
MPHITWGGGILSIAGLLEFDTAEFLLIQENGKFNLKEL